MFLAVLRANVSVSRMACLLTLGMMQAHVLQHKGEDTSVLERSYGSREAGEPSSKSEFLSKLRALVLELPPIYVYDFAPRAMLYERFSESLDSFQNWYIKLQDLYVHELQRQGRSEKEIAVYRDAFRRYQENIQNMKSEAFKEKYKAVPDEKLRRVLYDELLSFRSTIAELLFASSKKNLVCISCPVKTFLANLLGADEKSTQFGNLLKELYPTEIDQTWLKGEIDAASLSEDAHLRIMEFKFNRPHFEQDGYVVGGLRPEAAQKYSNQLYRLSRMLSRFYHSPNIVAKHGYTLSLNSNPELVFSPLAEYSGIGDLKTFIGPKAPDDLQYTKTQIFGDDEIDSIYKNLLSEIKQ